MIIGGVRKVIGFLQIYPIIITLVNEVVIITGMCGIYIYNLTDVLFGTSLFVSIGLYLVSKSLYVSFWSRVLYITLIAAILIETIDRFLYIPLITARLNEVLLLLLSVGIVVSLITFIYDKFKYKF